MLCARCLLRAGDGELDPVPAMGKAITLALGKSMITFKEDDLHLHWMVYPSERLRKPVVIRYIFFYYLNLKQLIKFLINVSKLPGDKKCLRSYSN